MPGEPGVCTLAASAGRISRRVSKSRALRAWPIASASRQSHLSPGFQWIFVGGGVTTSVFLEPWSNHSARWNVPHMADVRHAPRTADRTSAPRPGDRFGLALGLGPLFYSRPCLGTTLFSGMRSNPCDGSAPGVASMPKVARPTSPDQNSQRQYCHYDFCALASSSGAVPLQWARNRGFRVLWGHTAASAERHLMVIPGHIVAAPIPMSSWRWVVGHAPGSHAKCPDTCPNDYPRLPQSYAGSSSGDSGFLELPAGRMPRYFVYPTMWWVCICLRNVRAHAWDRYGWCVGFVPRLARREVDSLAQAAGQAIIPRPVGALCFHAFGPCAPPCGNGLALLAALLL